jgi:hypothetical protein
LTNGLFLQRGIVPQIKQDLTDEIYDNLYLDGKVCGFMILAGFLNYERAYISLIVFSGHIKELDNIDPNRSGNPKV